MTTGGLVTMPDILVFSQPTMCSWILKLSWRTLYNRAWLEQKLIGDRE